MKHKYFPTPIDTSGTELPADIITLSESIARNVHDTWALGRIREGWTIGCLDGIRKTHPGLVPYDELPESEKNYDRETVLATLKFIIASGFEIKKADA